MGASMEDLRLPFTKRDGSDLDGEEELFGDLPGDVDAGTVTPGITGRFAGGVRASGDCRICIKNALSYTILVPENSCVKSFTKHYITNIICHYKS